MSSWGELNGLRILEATVIIPYYGIWCGDVILTDVAQVPSPSPTILTIGNQTLFASVFRQLTFGGTSTLRLVGGFGGWQKTIAPRAYQNPAGIPLSLLLRDAASDCGESLGTSALQTTVNVGSAYVRESAPAMRVLKQLSGPIWWVDTAGNTQIVDRPLLPASGISTDTTHLGDILTPFTLIDYSGGKAKFRVAHESVADWMPGRTFNHPLSGGRQQIGMVTHMITRDGRLRTEVLTVFPQ